MRSLSSRKKGQVGSLAPAILSLIFAAVVLIFGVVISQNLRDNGIMKTTQTVTNETNAWLNITNYTVDTYIYGGRTDGFTLTAIWANTPDQANTYNYSIALPNASIDSSGSLGNITNVANATIYNNVSISYTYNLGEEGWMASNETISGLSTFGDFWSIIVLAIVISIVIALLLGVFGGRRGR